MIVEVTGGVPLHNPPPTPPPCFLCKGPSKRCITRESNRNGNAGRPYYKCFPCNKFLVFDDSRGNEPGNPECPCGYSSKRQVSGTGKRVARAVHFVCRMGTCDYYQAKEKMDGSREILDDEMMARFENLTIV